MTEILAVGLVTAGALTVAAAARARVKRRGPDVRVERLVDEPSLVVFTADHCVRCDQAMALARSQPLPLVQIRAEVDGAVMEALGVDAVPLTVVAGRGGNRVAQFGGVPSRRRLARAVVRAANTADD